MARSLFLRMRIAAHSDVAVSSTSLFRTLQHFVTRDAHRNDPSRGQFTFWILVRLARQLNLNAELRDLVTRGMRTAPTTNSRCLLLPFVQCQSTYGVRCQIWLSILFLSPVCHNSELGRNDRIVISHYQCVPHWDQRQRALGCQDISATPTPPWTVQLRTLAWKPLSLACIGDLEDDEPTSR